jgi:hypothetical protein
MPKSRPSRGKAQGSAWRKLVKATLSRHGTTCHLCGHGGATSADHLVPVTEDESRAMDLANLKPVHSQPHACATCSSAAGKPVYCNGIRGAMSIQRARRKIREMTGLTLPVNGEEGEGPREWLTD